MINKKTITTIITLGILILTALFASACSDTSGSAGTGSEGTSGTITEAGSTTVQPLAEKFASAFEGKYPGTTITVQGGGSGVGIKSANDGTVDIGAVSRELKSDDPDLIKWLIAKDGIALITNTANKIDGLTKEQIVEIYNGKITNWSQVGGENKDIHVVAREEGSGTRSAFQEMVMGEELILNTAILQSSNGAIRTTVIGDPQAIGFLSFGYLDNAVKALSVDGVTATEANALNGTYPIVRPLYFVTKTQPTGLVKTFLDFCLGDEGQKIVVAEGYLPIK